MSIKENWNFSNLREKGAIFRTITLEIHISEVYRYLQKIA